MQRLNILQRRPPTSTLLACGAVALTIAGAIGAFAPGTHAQMSLIDMCSAAIRATAAEQPFIAENDVAMHKMMTAMEIKPSGDVDRDFAAMMIPHHQGAIEMAQAELRHGHNEQLRRIAQEIVVEQQQEIIAMNVAIDQPLPPSAPAPTQAGTVANVATCPCLSNSTHSPTEVLK